MLTSPGPNLPPAPNLPQSPKLPKKPFLTPARLRSLVARGRRTLAMVLTFGGVVGDADIGKVDRSKMKLKDRDVGLHFRDQTGLRSVLEPAYLAASVPENVTDTISFQSPQIYARKFDIGQSVDNLDHQKLVSMISERLSHYMLSQIYGESFLEEDYLHESTQRSFKYRVKRIKFNASSSPEALLHGLSSMMIGNVDEENVDLAAIRLAKFKEALREACAQLNIDLGSAESSESVEEKQLTKEEESELIAL